MTEQEEPEERAGCAGYLVLAILVLGAFVALCLISRDAFILTVWLIVAVSVIWAARRSNKIENPSPPPPSDPSPQKKPQVSMMRDQSHPNRWVVTRPSRWLTDTHDKEG